MRVTVFGASGRTGQRLVEYALAEGHDVTALVRDPARLTVAGARLRVLTGDVLSDGDAARAADGSDAVLSALGVANAAAPGTVLSEGMRRIVEAMRECGVRRVLAVANAGVLDVPGGGIRADASDFPAEYRPIAREHAGAWRALRESDHAWTLVCTPDLKSGEWTGRVRAVRDRLPDGGREVSVEDVAAFMLAHAVSDTYARARVGIAY